MRALLKSFAYAWHGVVYCLRNERNMRIHLVVAVYLFALLPFFTLSKAETSVIVLTVAMVMTAEIINTTIENLVNLFSPKFSEFAKIVKDTAAGGVLVFSLAAVFVGFDLLLQPAAFRKMFRFFAGQPAISALFVLSLIFAFMYIFMGSSGIMQLFGRKIKRKNE